MSNTPNLHPSLSEQVGHVYEQAAERYGFDGTPTIISHGPPSWVAQNDETDPTSVVHVSYAEDADYAIAEAQQGVALMQDLRQAGAQLPEYFDTPWMKRVAVDRRDGFVVTHSEFLPGNDVTDYEHGQAVASLHNASKKVYTGDLSLVDPLNGESPVVEAVRYAKQFSHEEPLRIGDVVMTPDQIAMMETYLHKANAVSDQLFKLAEQHGSPLVVVQEDVHNGNRKRASDGTPTIYDIKTVVGPAAIDFGRPLNDWAIRLGRGHDAPKDFMTGYIDTIENHKLPPRDELELAAEFTNMRSSLLIAALAINAVRAGHPGESWMLGEGIHRLESIEDPNIVWHPLDDARKAAMRAGSA